MKKIIILLSVAFMTSTVAFAEYEQSGDINGHEVFIKHCKMCHIEMIAVTEAMKRSKTLQAPPMVEVSTRLKEMILLKEEDEDVKRELILTFMRDYIMNPNMDKSMCHLGALDRFDLMPSQKGIITDEEVQAVTEWIYDYYASKASK